MSLILDALNRSGQDAGQVPGLATVHYQAQPEEDPGAKRRQLLLGAALVIALLAITWLLLDRRQEPIATNSAEQPAVQVSRPDLIPPAATPVAAPVATSVARAPGEAAVSRPAPVTRRAPPVEPPPTSTAAVTTSSPQSRQAPSPREKADATATQEAAVAALYRQRRLADTQSASGEPVNRSVDSAGETAGSTRAKGKSAASDAAAWREDEPVDIEQMVLLAQEDLKNDRLSKNATPFLATMSQQTKDIVPTLLYSQHDYSGDPAHSSVALNGKTLKTGASVKGVKVEEILPDSVVLSYQGIRFRLRALNSWVNL